MSVNRRDFIKGSAAAAGVLAAGEIGRRAGLGDTILAARTAEKLEELYDIDPVIQRVDERNIMFSRAVWDAPVIEWGIKRGETARANFRSDSVHGYRRLDMALRNAGWAMTVLGGYGTGAGTRGATLYPSGPYVDRPVAAMVPPEPIQLSPDNAAQAVKKAAKYLGADLVGISLLDERWVFSHYFCRGGATAHGPIEIGDFESHGMGEDGTYRIPRRMKYVITLGFKQQILPTTTSPTLVASGAVGQGYVRMGIVSYSLAEFIFGLGFQAIASGNDLAIGAPHAVAAGLGELGRNGMLVTPECGPNLRLAKVVTDLPMTIDKPKDFGVRKFCESCKKCAEHCPGQCIPDGGMQKDPVCMSNIGGTLRWVVDVEKCYKFWCDSGDSCASCMAVCPYTKDTSIWTHSLGAKLAPTFGSAFVALDDMLGYGPKDVEEFWGFEY